MDNERSAVIKIGDEDYQLILSTRATKEIAKRYGGLDNLGDKLMCRQANTRGHTQREMRRSVRAC